MYIPKGSMCAVCAKRRQTCSGYKFNEMQVVKVTDNYKVVVCDHFIKDKK